MLLMAITGLLFGTIVDRHKKKRIMLVATAITTITYIIAAIIFITVGERQLLYLGAWFWVFSTIILIGAIVENIRSIALSTCVTIMVEPEVRDKANGLVGAVTGLGFMITSVFSGLAIGFLGMGGTIAISVALTALSLIHLLTVRIPEDHIEHDPELTKTIDVKGAWRIIQKTPGLMALLLFSMLNNLLGGVYMALLDPYGLSLVSVQIWGIIYGVSSVGFIIGGMIIHQKGLGSRPLRALLLGNIGLWTVGMLFAIRETIVLTAIGMIIYMMLSPIIEAAEQTTIQRVVPLNQQGRVFGFGQSAEALAAPITSFLIGPIAQFWLLPYTNSPEGKAQLNWLLGSGDARGIALVFLVTGIIGLIITVLAFRTKSYRAISKSYANS